MNIKCITLLLLFPLNFLVYSQSIESGTHSKTTEPGLKLTHPSSGDKKPMTGHQDKTEPWNKEVIVAFYNLENLFHPSDDPTTFDDDRTPDGADQWTPQKYNDKLSNMARVIADIGPSTPAIIGLCELENRQVLLDLLRQDALSTIDYAIIHHESPDLRGIDVGLIYRKSQFKPHKSISIAVPLYDEKRDRPIYTRDQLLIQGDLLGQPIYILVNHWPSRSGGKQRSESKRLGAAKVTKRLTDSLLRLNPQSQIIVMGDFNDNPDDSSIQHLIDSGKKQYSDNFKDAKISQSKMTTDFFNPFEKIYLNGFGSLAYRDRWFLFDQIILTHNFTQKTPKWSLKSASIHKPDYLVTPTGRFKGYPFRSMRGSHFTGGYSDHFAVYITLTK